MSTGKRVSKADVRRAFLIRIYVEGPHFLLHKSKKYTLGRKDCDILINDKSVSRVHSELIVSPLKNPSDVNSLSKLTVADKSKFGTFVNRVRCDQDKEIILKDGDIIVFGVNNSQLKVKYHPIDICFSNVKTEIKASLQNTLSKIGAHVYNDYVPTKITHLVMSELEVTSKVLLALIEGIFVITPQWLFDVESKSDGLITPLPNVIKYLPPLKEDECTLDQFKPDPKRKTLFTGKTFIFMTEKQYQKAHRIVEAAGGIIVQSFHEHEVNKSPRKKKSAAHIAEKSEPFTVDYLLKNRTSCFIDPTEFLSTLSKDEKIIVEQKVKMLSDFDFQLLSEDEIGFSVLHSSIDKFCNPKPPPKEKFVIPEIKPAVVAKKKVELKPIEVSPKKAPAKKANIKDLLKKQGESKAPAITIEIDEKSTEEKSAASKKATSDVKKQLEDKKKRAEEEKKKQAEEKAKAAAEEEKKRVAEEKKKQAEEEKKKQLEEKKRIEAEKKKAEEDKKKQLEKKRLEDEKKQQIEEEKKKKQLEEEKKKKLEAEKEKKRLEADKTKEKSVSSDELSVSVKNSKETSSDNIKHDDSAQQKKETRPKISLSTANTTATKPRISLSTRGTSATGSKPQPSASKDDDSKHEEDANGNKETSSQRKRVIMDDSNNDEKMDVDLDLDTNENRNDLSNNNNNTNQRDAKQGTKRKRSGSLANSFDESDERENNLKVQAATSAAVSDPNTSTNDVNNNNSNALLSTPSRNVKRFKKSVSPVEKSPRPKVISTEVHDLSKDKKEHEIWFKEQEKQYTEEEKKQKEADALFAYSVKNPTANTKKKVK